MTIILKVPSGARVIVNGLDDGPVTRGMLREDLFVAELPGEITIQIGASKAATLDRPKFFVQVLAGEFADDTLYVNEFGDLKSAAAEAERVAARYIERVAVRTVSQAESVHRKVWFTSAVREHAQLAFA